jgi:thiol-disulfide isomerase/thioredoxin
MQNLLMSVIFIFVLLILATLPQSGNSFRIVPKMAKLHSPSSSITMSAVSFVGPGDLVSPFDVSSNRGRKIWNDSDNSFYEMITSQDISIVIFTTSWCDPCKNMEAIIGNYLSKKTSKVNFVVVDADDKSELAADFRIRSIPTTVIFKKGEICAEIVGMIPESILEQKVEKYASDFVKLQ